MKGTNPTDYAYCDSPYACAAAPIVARKWVPVIVCHLLHGAKRYSEIRKVVPFLSNKVLSENLQEMEEEGMLQREVRNSHPIEVWYQLTAKGEDLSKVIHAMNSWGERWLGRSTEIALQLPKNAESSFRKRLG